MQNVIMNTKDKLAIKLLHYFITEEKYSPIILHGAKDEVWLENLDNPYKIIRIVSNYIHNNEQLKLDLVKCKKISKVIKRKTLSININVLSIYLDTSEYVDIQNFKNEKNLVFIKEEKDILDNALITSNYGNINKISNELDDVDLFFKLTTDITNIRNKENEKTEDLFSFSKPKVIVGFITLCLFAYLFMNIFSVSFENNILYKIGTFSYDLFKNNNYINIITNAFVSDSLVFLILSIYFMYILGIQVESFYGFKKSIYIYIYSIITGSMLGILFNKSIIFGPTSIIMGMVGSLLYFGYHYRVYLLTIIKSQLLPIIITLILLLVIYPFYNIFVLLGSLLGGVLSSMLVQNKYKKNSIDRFNGYIISILYIITLIIFVYVL